MSARYAQRGSRGRLMVRERKRRVWAVLIAVIGAAASLWFVSGVVALVSGHGWLPITVHVRSPLVDGGNEGLVGLPRYRPSSGGVTTDPLIPRPQLQDDGETASRWRLPVAVRWPVSLLWSAILAIPLWTLWLQSVVRGVWGRRRDGLADAADIRRSLGARHARGNGKVTWPGTPWWHRVLLPTSAFGYHLGHSIGRFTGRRVELWARFESNVRIIAHTGWGKTLRLLVPIVRTLPAAALISTNEQQLFTHTVQARRFRRPPTRWPVLRVLPSRRAVREHPVAVADFSDPDNLWSAGFPQVRWNPLPGSEDHFVALRRARALVSGTEPDKGQSRNSGEDRFWRQSAADVIAAWLHAAALGGRELEELSSWLADTDHPTPRRLLADDRRAEPTALTALDKHLDRRAEGTTSGVERYVLLGISALVSRDGRRFCSTRARADFDPVELIGRGGTIYVLADDERIEPVRPLLSMFTAEVFIAARRAALRHGGARLPVPFLAVLDELRHSVVVPNLPYVGNTMRKHGVGFVYSVQTSTHEDELYGDQAGALRQSCGVTVVGGLDMSVAAELTTRAGTELRADRVGGQDHTEQLTRIEALPVSDQQKLQQGQAVIAARGVGLFLGHCPLIRDRFRSYRRILREVADVRRIVRRARNQHRASVTAQGDAASTGSNFKVRPGGDHT
ncbi:hypothetical protein Lesp02_03240 [Lentzea sp. NBRC 105346]|nr:hypothetical protein Lesp02_03240 [Lentzea sp. NBRC 105346]